MADLTVGQIPLQANVPNEGMGKIVGSSNTVTLGTSANSVAMYTAGLSGGRIYSLIGSTDDTTAVNVMLFTLTGSTVSPIGLVNIPISSGNVSGTAAVGMLASLAGLPLDEQGNRYIPMMPSEVLRGGALANLSATGKSCWVSAKGSDYQ
jgi:hypothetical protein